MSGVVFAQTPESSSEIRHGLTHIGNNIPAISAGLRYLGNCVLAGSLIIAVAQVVSSRWKKLS
jgi:hypothetical protein